MQTSSTMSRQDFLSVTVDARNKIIERLVTKYDVQIAADAARDRILDELTSMHAESQALMRQSNAQSDQLWRKTANLEAQLGELQKDLQTLTKAVKGLTAIQSSVALA